MQQYWMVDLITEVTESNALANRIVPSTSAADNWYRCVLPAFYT